MKLLKLLRLTWFVIFGLLPFWITLVVVIWGAIGQTPENFWGAAPFYVLIAIPYSGITMGIAAVTDIVYERTTGDAWRKLKHAGAWFALLLLLLLAVIANLWHH